MKTKFIYLFAVAVVSFNLHAGEQESKAPSGKELSEVHTSERSRATVEMPGRDTPARVEREGRTTHVDFDPQGHVGTAHERDTTIVNHDD